MTEPDDIHRCFICREPFKAGEMVLPDVTEGLGHRVCFGEDRDGYVKDIDTGEPLGVDAPIPAGKPYDPADYPEYAASAAHPMTVDANRVSLLPCPFCGEQPKFKEREENDSDRAPRPHMVYYVECESCDFRMDMWSNTWWSGSSPPPENNEQRAAKVKAIAAWNRRSPSLSGGEVVAWADSRDLGKVSFDVRTRQAGRYEVPLYASPAPDIIAAKDAEIERLTKERDEAFAANERDRSIIADARSSFAAALARRSWLLNGGRGSYEWDDDRWKEEFGLAIDELSAPLDALGKIGIDWSLCPTNPEEIAAARIDWKSRAEAAEARANAAVEALREIANTEAPDGTCYAGALYRSIADTFLATLSSLNGAKP